MSYKADNSIIDRVTMPTTVDGDESRPFSIPNGAKVLTIHMPAMVGDASVKIQKLYPQQSDQETEVWADLSALVIATTVGFCALNSIPENVATTIPTAALGGGIFRFVSSADQTGVADAITIILSWGMDG